MRELWLWTTQDMAVNHEGKARTVLRWWRLAQRARAGTTPFPRLLERVIDRAYRSFTAWFLCVELHPDAVAGPGLVIYHCHMIVVHPTSRLGTGCVLRGGVCLGNKGEDGRGPVLGDNVDVGFSALLIGQISVGDRATIGAGAVVVRDVPADCVVAGNPARTLSPAAA